MRPIEESLCTMMTKIRKNVKKRELEDDSSREMAVERAYSHLRKKAIGFECKPGERIKDIDIAVELKMSRGPVREALNRLAMNQLVVFESGKGFFSRRLSIREITELFELRTELETNAVRGAIRKAPDGEIELVRASWLAIVAKQNVLELDTLVDCDEEFHIQIAELAGNSERTRCMRNINERIRFIRGIHLEDEQSRIIIMGDHAKLIDAIANRDEGKAMELIENHVQFSADFQSFFHTGIIRIYGDDS